MSRALRLALVSAIAVQVYVLYLYVPDGASTLALPHLDKGVHAAIFALPAALAVLAGFRTWVVGLALTVHAPLSELVQYVWLPARSGDPWDLVADLAGVILGVTMGRLLPVGTRFLAPGGLPARTHR